MTKHETRQPKKYAKENLQSKDKNKQKTTCSQVMTLYNEEHTFFSFQWALNNNVAFNK